MFTWGTSNLKPPDEGTVDNINTQSPSKQGNSPRKSGKTNSNSRGGIPSVFGIPLDRDADKEPLLLAKLLSVLSPSGKKAMAFPASGLEATYRNDINEVSRLLKRYHENHFMIFNLSGRDYDYSKFDHQVLEFPFQDHHSPPLDLLMSILFSMDSWLTADRRHVCVVHCKGGKGRTGTVIACYLMYKGIFDSAEEAMNFFAKMRSTKEKGVTQISQKRYVNYFHSIITQKVRPRPRRLLVTEIMFSCTPRFTKRGCRPYFKVYDSGTFPRKLIHASYNPKDDTHPINNPTDSTRNYSTPSVDDKEPIFHDADTSGDMVWKVHFHVTGDTLIKFNHLKKKKRPGRVKKGRLNMFRFSFHTAFLEENSSFTDGKRQLGKDQLVMHNPQWATMEEKLQMLLKLHGGDLDVNTLVSGFNNKSNSKPISNPSSTPTSTSTTTQHETIKPVQNKNLDNNPKVITDKHNDERRDGKDSGNEKEEIEKKEEDRKEGDEMIMRDTTTTMNNEEKEKQKKEEEEQEEKEKSISNNYIDNNSKEGSKEEEAPSDRMSHRLSRRIHLSKKKDKKWNDDVMMYREHENVGPPIKITLSPADLDFAGSVPKRFVESLYAEDFLITLTVHEAPLEQNVVVEEEEMHTHKKDSTVHARKRLADDVGITELYEHIFAQMKMPEQQRIIRFDGKKEREEDRRRYLKDKEDKGKKEMNNKEEGIIKEQNSISMIEEETTTPTLTRRGAAGGGNSSEESGDMRSVSMKEMGDRVTMLKNIKEELQSKTSLEEVHSKKASLHEQKKEEEEEEKDVEICVIKEKDTKQREENLQSIRTLSTSHTNKGKDELIIPDNNNNTVLMKKKKEENNLLTSTKKGESNLLTYYKYNKKGDKSSQGFSGHSSMPGKGGSVSVRYRPRRGAGGRNDGSSGGWSGWQKPNSLMNGESRVKGSEHRCPGVGGNRSEYITPSPSSLPSLASSWVGAVPRVAPPDTNNIVHRGEVRSERSMSLQTPHHNYSLWKRHSPSGFSIHGWREGTSISRGRSDASTTTREREDASTTDTNKDSDNDNDVSEGEVKPEELLEKNESNLKEQ